MKSIKKKVLSIFSIVFCLSFLFAENSVLTNSMLEVTAANLTFSYNGVNYEVVSSTNAEVCVTGGTKASLKIPKTISYGGTAYKVISIKSRAFKLNSVTKTIDMTQATELKEIQNYAFQNCDMLSSIELPKNLKYIGDLAFYYNTHLYNISIPDSVEYIGRMAFYNCTSLESIEMTPNSRTIVSDAFYGTPYYRYNYFASESFPRQLYGSAKSCVGRQVVVNIFVDSCSGTAKTKTVNGKTYYYDQNDNLFRAEGTMEMVENIGPVSTVFIYDGNEKLLYKVITSGKGSDIYNSSESFIGTDTSILPVAKSESQGFSGEWQDSTKGTKQIYSAAQNKYISSSSIDTRISIMNEALSNLKQQADEYNVNVEFITADTDKDLAIHYTHNEWDGSLLLNVVPGPGANKLGKPRGNTAGSLQYAYRGAGSFNFVVNGLKNCKDANGQLIDLSADSEYTKYLKNKYKASGVVYNYVLKNDYYSDMYSKAVAYALPKDENSFSSDPEEAFYMDGHNVKNPTKAASVFEHEMLHLYGVYDHYNFALNMSSSMSTAADIYSYLFLSNDIMGNTDSTKISQITAYAIGWSNNIRIDEYKIFYSGTDYKMGDLNLDGAVNAADMNILSSGIKGSTMLTPVQKVMVGYSFDIAYNNSRLNSWMSDINRTDNGINIGSSFYQYGDVNFDGVLNESDKTIIRSISKGNEEVYKIQQMIADVNNDGVINSSDINF